MGGSCWWGNFWPSRMDLAMRILRTMWWSCIWHGAKQKIQYQRRRAARARAKPTFVLCGVTIGDGRMEGPGRNLRDLRFADDTLIFAQSRVETGKIFWMRSLSSWIALVCFSACLHHVGRNYKMWICNNIIFSRHGRPSIWTGGYCKTEMFPS